MIFYYIGNLFQSCLYSDPSRMEAIISQKVLAISFIVPNLGWCAGIIDLLGKKYGARKQSSRK